VLPLELARQREVDGHQGTRLPTHEERPGARVYKETQEPKDSGDRYRAEGIRNFGKTSDAVKNVTTMVREGLGSPGPTGQHTAVPRGDYYAQQPPGAASTDPVVGAAAGAFMVAETVRAVRRARAKRKKEHDGNG
jgi:hypothetical protein